MRLRGFRPEVGSKKRSWGCVFFLLQALGLLKVM
jgi:hypothetical protein